MRENRTYWEQLAPHRPGEPLEFFREGGSALTEPELAAIGDVRGRRVLHLACSVGDESLTFAQRGAIVTAVDLAPSHLTTGRVKAEALGLPVEFIEQDMMTLDPAITGFDIIYISWGGLCWVPDITQWTQIVAERLNPGGVLVISEHHPLWEVLTVRGPNSLSISSDYFGTHRDGYTDPSKAPQVTQRIGTPTVPHRSYIWSLAAVATATLNAGLTLQSLQEFPEPDLYDGLGEQASHLPATYLLTASRP
ncbi:class I SAM-dependent methyltransferase [Kribbella jejuensis]|uniref:Methyltransferase family protein n=1 Tax=Kribbella jejuensis TaxID=236068 RepID=A0A542DTY1_9ACTN|nr:methyltransferase family protein [Kribbella jejuensis]